MEWNTAILTKTYGYIKVAILRTFEYEKTSVGFNYKVFLTKGHATSHNNTLKNELKKTLASILRTLASNLQLDLRIVFSGSQLTCGDVFDRFLTSVLRKSWLEVTGPPFLKNVLRI